MNKYNLNWQLTRVQNRKLNLTDKLHKIRIFLSAYPSPENKERVLNYLLGLEKGYKTIEQRAMVRSTYNFLKDKQCNEPDVEIKIELNNHTEKSDVYGYSVFEVELPEYVQSVELTNVSTLYGEGLI